MGSARVLPARHEVPPPCVAVFTQGLRRKGGRPQEEELLESAAATVARRGRRCAR
ncbi:formin-like protein 5 isoform X1 [Iris pallida]|uniref:Formin-like protein 5 isoform X1 n=1 Tax=Iris pallida TaxID=29817 RepID=A0AAX6ET59_IRIPA|nr:formin-like protein 5 isoform X1 [Iris pallida]